MWVERIANRPDLVPLVAEKMREWDRREVFATRFDDDPQKLAQEAQAIGSNVGWVSGHELNPMPIAAFGCHMLWPGVWSLWLFATDDFRQIRFSMTKLIARSILPMLWDSGAHRLEARSMEGHHDAQRWMEMIGAKREGTLKGYGRAGEDFHVYAWEKR